MRGSFLECRGISCYAGKEGWHQSALPCGSDPGGGWRCRGQSQGSLHWLWPPSCWLEAVWRAVEDTQHICVNSTDCIRTLDDTHHICVNSTGCMRSLDDAYHICINSTGCIRTVDDTHHSCINSTGRIRTVEDTKQDCKSSTGKITKSQIQLHKQGTFNYWNVSYDDSCLWPTLSHLGMDVLHIIHIYTDQFHLILRTNPLPLPLQPQHKKIFLKN